MDDTEADTRNARTGWPLPVGTAAAWAFTSNLLISNDWCFAAITAAILAAGLAAVFLGSARLVARGRLSRTFRVGIGIVVGLGVGLACRLTDATAFRIVFQTDPPESVTDVVAERWYAGGPGDEVLLMHFRTDAVTLDTLLKPRGFQLDVDVTRLWNEVFKEHKDIWEHVFGGLLPKGHRWHELTAPDNPAVYTGGNGISPNIVMLWDPAEQKAYVLYSVG